VKFSPAGLMVFVAFAAILTLAGEPRYGVAAIAAAIIVELLLWCGAFGIGRAPDSTPR
jgi:hypothetical protein